jgi:hypothetical protein
LRLKFHWKKKKKNRKRPSIDGHFVDNGTDKVPSRDGRHEGALVGVRRCVHDAIEDFAETRIVDLELQRRGGV